MTKYIYYFLNAVILLSHYNPSMSYNRIFTPSSDVVHAVNVTNFSRQDLEYLRNLEIPLFLYRYDYSGESPIAELRFTFDDIKHVNTYIVDGVDSDSIGLELSSIYDEFVGLIQYNEMTSLNVKDSNEILDKVKTSVLNVSTPDQYDIDTLLSQGWLLNSTVYSAEYKKMNGNKYVGKITHSTLVYEQLIQGHYLTRVESNVDFIPGVVLASTDSNYKLWNIGSKGTYSLTSVEQRASCYYGYCLFSDSPNIIDHWPVNDSVVDYAINSSWGLPITFGYSSENGVSGEFGFSFGRTTGYVESSPRLNVTPIVPLKSYLWSYDQLSKAARHLMTHSHQQGLIVEQPNNSSLKGFRVKIDAYMQVANWLLSDELHYTFQFSIYGGL